MANFMDADMKTMGQSRKESGLNEYAQSLFDPTLSWDDVKWLQSISKLPVVLKGILRGAEMYI
jgi:isopentenyl diphosphate isomerase/L-lactate dehydrogenase-like FMN-dependent dehydrogenase